MGTLPVKARMTSHEMPASRGAPGPGLMTMQRGASAATSDTAGARAGWVRATSRGVERRVSGGARHVTGGARHVTGGRARRVTGGRAGARAATTHA